MAKILGNYGAAREGAYFKQEQVRVEKQLAGRLVRGLPHALTVMLPAGGGAAELPAAAGARGQADRGTGGRAG